MAEHTAKIKEPAIVLKKMTRKICVDPFPIVPASVPPDAVIVTPHPAAADALGIVHTSLLTIATGFLCKKSIGVASDMAARHLLKAAIHEISPGSDSGAVAARIAPVLETVLRTGIDTGVIRRHGSPSVRRFADIAERYKKKLRARDLVDRQEVLLKAAAIVPEPKKLFIYGYHRARPEEIAFIDALAADGSFYFLPYTDHRMFASNGRWIEYLKNKGWTEAEYDPEKGPSAGKILAARFAGRPVSDEVRVRGSKADGDQPALPFFGVETFEETEKAGAFSYSDIEQEIRGTLAQAKMLAASGNAPERIAIVCRDTAVYAPFIESISEEYEIPVQTDHLIPVSATTTGNFIRLVFDAVKSDFEFEPTARLVQHSFGPGVSDTVWHDVRRRRIAGCDEWPAAGVDITCLRAPEQQTFLEWTQWIRNVLAVLDVRSNAGKSAREMNACNSFNEALDELGRLETSRAMTLDEFAAAVYEILSNEQTRFKPGSGGTALHDPDTILGADLDHIFVVGMAEGMTPPTIVDNAVIDFYDRKRFRELGIELRTAADVSRWEELSFYFILPAAKKTITFSYPRIVDGQEKVPSAFFGRLGIEPSKAEANSTISSVEEQRRIYLRRSDHTLKGDDIFEGAMLRLDAEHRREASAPCDEYDGVIGVPVEATGRKWSISQLTQIGQCPFRWFTARLLKLKPPEEGELELDPAKRGSLYHKTLEIAMRRAKDAHDVRRAVLDELRAAFEEAEKDEKLALPKLRNWAIERLDHLEQLRKAVESPAFISEGAAVVGIEQSYEAEWEGFTLKGSIDRVDETPEGLIAIDYKTSAKLPKGVKDASGKLSIDVQIPIYSRVALPSLYPDKPLGKSSYYSLTKGKTLKEGEEEISPELYDFADRVHRMLSTGSFPVAPDTGRKACQYCDFDLLCRKGQRLERKTRA